MYDVPVMSYYVTVTNELYLNVRNDEYIILCKFGGRTISHFEIIGGGPPKPPLPHLPGPSKPKKPGLNRVKSYNRKCLTSHQHINIQVLYNEGDFFPVKLF